MQARRRWIRWFQRLVLTLDAFWAVDWEAVREVEETVEGDPREEQPVILEGVRKFLQLYICFESDLAPHSWQYHHKYSSGRDKHEVLAEMTNHLGDSSTKATDKGQVGWEQLSEPIHMRAEVIKNQVMYELTTCIAAAIDADVANLYLVEEEGQLSVFPHGSGSGWGIFI